MRRSSLGRSHAKRMGHSSRLKIWPVQVRGLPRESDHDGTGRHCAVKRRGRRGAALRVRSLFGHALLFVQCPALGSKGSDCRFDGFSGFLPPSHMEGVSQKFPCDWKETRYTR